MVLPRLRAEPMSCKHGPAFLVECLNDRIVGLKRNEPGRQWAIVPGAFEGLIIHLGLQIVIPFGLIFLKFDDGRFINRLYTSFSIPSFLGLSKEHRKARTANKGVHLTPKGN